MALVEAGEATVGTWADDIPSAAALGVIALGRRTGAGVGELNVA